MEVVVLLMFFFQQVALFPDGLKGLLTHEKRHICAVILWCGGFKSVSIHSSTSGNNCLRSIFGACLHWCSFFCFGLWYVSWRKSNYQIHTQPRRLIWFNCGVTNTFDKQSLNLYVMVRNGWVRINLTLRQTIVCVTSWWGVLLSSHQQIHFGDPSMDVLLWIDQLVVSKVSNNTSFWPEPISAELDTSNKQKTWTWTKAHFH